MEEFDRSDLIRVYHDECIFHNDQHSFWCDGSFNPVKSKSEGRAIMVSDFIVEAGRSFLQDQERQLVAREYLEAVMGHISIYRQYAIL